jgi:hypothetical protein
MKRTFIASLFLFAIVSIASAQTAAKSIYVELGGPGIASLNFDTRFSKGEKGLGGRIGIGGWKVEDEGYLTVPVGINYLLGKDNKNYFEIGAGFTYVHTSDNTFDGNSTFDGTFGHLTFGYRLQPANGGFTFRAAIVPVFGQGDFIPYYAGISFGYKF